MHYQRGGQSRRTAPLGNQILSLLKTIVYQRHCLLSTYPKIDILQERQYTHVVEINRQRLFKDIRRLFQLMFSDMPIGLIDERFCFPRIYFRMISRMS